MGFFTGGDEFPTDIVDGNLSAHFSSQHEIYKPKSFFLSGKHSNDVLEDDVEKTHCVAIGFIISSIMR